MKYTYQISKLGDCLPKDRVSCDPDYSVVSLAGIISAHNQGILDIEQELWFGSVESYQFAPKTAPVVVAVPYR